MHHAIQVQSPEKCESQLDLPSGKSIKGMGIPKG
ncbi:ABC-ATPase domain-containing protein, partial [Enterobacter quasiroggenkampii]|nr:ABC-ATPase domain-containing protein [Enterobacter quasiroggenkampii]